MADQAKSLRRRKSIVSAFNTIRGRISNNDNAESNVEQPGQKNNGWDLFGTLRSSKSPSRQQQENGTSTVRALSTSPPKRGPLAVRLKRPESSSGSPKLKRRKSLGDILSLGRSNPRKDKASTIGNLPSQPSLGPREGNLRTEDGFLTLPEAAMEDYASESLSTVMTTKPCPPAASNSSVEGNIRTSQPNEVTGSTGSEDAAASKEVSKDYVKYEASVVKSCEKEACSHQPSPKQPGKTTPKASVLLAEKDVKQNHSRYQGLLEYSPEGSSILSYAEVLDGKIPDWAVDLDPDFKPRQASLNMQYNRLLDRSDMQWLTGVDSTLEYNDTKITREMERRDYEHIKLSRESYMDNLEPIIALTAAKMSENFQVNTAATSKRQQNMSEATTVENFSCCEPLTRTEKHPNTVSNNTPIKQVVDGSQNDKNNNKPLPYESMWPSDDRLSPIQEKKEGKDSNMEDKSATPHSEMTDTSAPYLRGGRGSTSHHMSDVASYSDPNPPTILRRGARNTKRSSRVGEQKPVSVMYPEGRSMCFASITDALSDIFAQEHLDLSDYCIYDKVKYIIYTSRRLEQEPLHVLLKHVSKDRELIWTPSFARHSQAYAADGPGRVTPDPRVNQEVPMVYLSKDSKGNPQEQIKYIRNPFLAHEKSVLRSIETNEDSAWSDDSTTSHLFDVIGGYYKTHSDPGSTNHASLSHPSDISRRLASTDDRISSSLVISPDQPDQIPIQRIDHDGNTIIRYPNMIALNSAVAESSVHHQQPSITSRKASGDQRRERFNDSTDSYLAEFYEMPVEDSDGLRIYLGSDFSNSDQNLSFTSKSPGGQSQINLTENQENDVAYSLKDTNFTEAPKAKNWLDMVREHKDSQSAMKAEVSKEYQGHCSGPSGGSNSTMLLYQEHNLSSSVWDYDLDGDAGSVEDNLLSDSEIDSNEYVRQLDGNQDFRDGFGTPEGNGASKSTMLEPINLRRRQSSALVTLEKLMKRHVRKDSGVSFESEVRLPKYNKFDSTLELNLDASTSRSVSQNLKGIRGNTPIPEASTNKTLLDDICWDNAETEPTFEELIHRRDGTQYHATRLMTPSGCVHLPSTTHQTYDGENVSTLIQRTSTPQSHAITPNSQSILAHRANSPVDLPGPGLRAAPGHVNTLLSFQNMPRVTNHEPGQPKQDGDRTTPEEIDRRKRSKVETIKTTTMHAHLSAPSINRNVSEISLTDISNCGYSECVDSGTEADDEEDRGGADSSPFWQDYFSTQFELFDKKI